MADSNRLVAPRNAAAARASEVVVLNVSSSVDNPAWNAGWRWGLSTVRRGKGVHHVDVTPSQTFQLGVPPAQIVKWS